jgi:hypothetical protein
VSDARAGRGTVIEHVPDADPGPVAHRADSLAQIDVALTQFR